MYLFIYFGIPYKQTNSCTYHLQSTVYSLSLKNFHGLIKRRVNMTGTIALEYRKCLHITFSESYVKYRGAKFAEFKLHICPNCNPLINLRLVASRRWLKFLHLLIMKPRLLRASLLIFMILLIKRKRGSKDEAKVLYRVNSS